jgi:hypothetical protein
MMTTATKRPLAWRLDDALGTVPLFDLLATGPRHGVREWASSIAWTSRMLASPGGRAWMAWRRSVWAGSPRSDELYRRSCAISRLERWKRRRRA